MKVIMGSPKTIFAVGMAPLSDISVPFIGFVEAGKMKENPKFTFGNDARVSIEDIHDSGGVVVYIENPDAAHTMMEYMAALFSAASSGDWGELEQVMEEMQ
jgi:hypothetical protein